MPQADADAEARGVFAPLCADHDVKRCLLRAFSISNASGARQRALERLQRFVRMHDRAEHTTVYGALLANARTRALAQQAIDEHHGLDAKLSDLAEATSRGAEHAIQERLGAYRSLLTVHLLREEQELFPHAYRALGPERCRRIVRRFQDVRAAAGAFEI